jgi:hypothetical protein
MDSSEIKFSRIDIGLPTGNLQEGQIKYQLARGSYLHHEHESIVI